LPSRTVSIAIARDPQGVCDFVTDPRNLPRWAPGFARSVDRSADGWIVDTADGPMPIEFVARNTLGVADHRVTVAPGVDVLNHLRVIANGSGSEVMFTLFQTADTLDDRFDADVARVEADLQALKRILEAGEA